MGSGEHTTRAAPVEAVCFDVTHTLIHCPRVAEIYSEVLERHGIAAAPADLRQVIPRAWQELSCRIDPRRDRFSLHPRGERGWWHRFLERVCLLVEAPPPSRFASAELLDRFARASAWEVYPDVVPVLEMLRSAGLRLGVVSNWDHRLPKLLDRLGLSRFFDAVVYSAACGVEKPHPLIFERCLRALEVAPGRAIHLGDHPLEDVEGAAGAGLEAIRVDRRRPDTDLGRLLGAAIRKRRTARADAVGRRGAPGHPRTGVFPVLFTTLLAAAVWAAGCRQSPGEQKPPPAVDVEPALEIPIDNDPVAVERGPELVGVLPGDFPADLPLYLPASLIDFGTGEDGWRYVELLTPHALARTDPGLATLLAERGWASDGASGGSRLLRKGSLRVRLRVENARPGTSYRFEYR